MECESQAFYSPPAKNYEAEEAKKGLEYWKKEAQDWQLAFQKNVAMRRGYKPHEVTVNKDGHAQIR